jgi:hypothetical protein
VRRFRIGNWYGLPSVRQTTLVESASGLRRILLPRGSSCGSIDVVLIACASQSFVHRHAVAWRMACFFLGIMTCFDSIVVLEKRKKNAPIALARGSGGHASLPQAMSFLDLRRICKIPD